MAVEFDIGLELFKGDGVAGLFSVLKRPLIYRAVNLAEIISTDLRGFSAV